MARGCELRREVPLVVRLGDGTLVEGRVDVMWSDRRELCTVVDYKTDRRDYRKVGQLQLYALGMERVTGAPVRAIVLEV